MKTILIDPVAQTLTDHEIDGETLSLQQMYEALKCDDVQAINLGTTGPLKIDLWVNGEGMDINETTRYFVLHTDDKPHNLIAGRGLIAASNRSLDSVGLPGHVTAARMEPCIKFVPESQSGAAADLAEQLLDLTTVVGSQEEMDALMVKSAAILKQAMMLCEVPA